MRARAACHALTPRATRSCDATDAAESFLPPPLPPPPLEGVGFARCAIARKRTYLPRARVARRVCVCKEGVARRARAWRRRGQRSQRSQGGGRLRSGEAHGIARPSGAQAARRVQDGEEWHFSPQCLTSIVDLRTSGARWRLAYTCFRVVLRLVWAASQSIGRNGKYAYTRLLTRSTHRGARLHASHVLLRFAPFAPRCPREPHRVLSLTRRANCALPRDASTCKSLNSIMQSSPTPPEAAQGCRSRAGRGRQARPHPKHHSIIPSIEAAAHAPVCVHRTHLLK